MATSMYCRSCFTSTGIGTILDPTLHISHPHHTATGNNRNCTILPVVKRTWSKKRRVEWGREDAQDGVAGLVVHHLVLWCTIWCCTREQSQASHHPVITVPHYDRHTVTSGCNQDSRDCLLENWRRILCAMTRNNGLQKSAGSVGSPVNQDTRLYVKEVRDSV